MLALRSVLTAALVVLAACGSDAITAAFEQSQPTPQPSGVTTLTGFVALYGDDDVRLVTGGTEVQLLGALDQVIPHAGLEVAVAGRFLSAGRFWVDSATVIATKPRNGEPEDS